MHCWPLWFAVILVVQDKPPLPTPATAATTTTTTTTTNNNNNNNNNHNHNNNNNNNNHNNKQQQQQQQPQPQQQLLFPLPTTLQIVLIIPFFFWKWGTFGFQCGAQSYWRWSEWSTLWKDGGQSLGRCVPATWMATFGNQVATANGLFPLVFLLPHPKKNYGNSSGGTLKCPHSVQDGYHDLFWPHPLASKDGSHESKSAIAFW